MSIRSWTLCQRASPCPKGRAKPWGTGHAVLCCRDTVKEPFAVINADDYYGRECFRLLADFLSKPGADAKKHIAMAGYILENTLTENGYVSRGICTVEPDGTLTDLVERTHIEIREGVSQFTEDDGATWETLPAGCYVSMNCWPSRPDPWTASRTSSRAS